MIIIDSLIYLGYARKSSEGKDRQSQSIGTQVEILTSYAKRNDLNLIKILKESKSTKEDGNRPQFDLLVSKLVAGEANAVFSAHVDRLARNGIEAGQLVKLFTQGILKEIKTPNNTYNTIKSLMYLEIEFAVASSYSRDLSVRVKEGIKYKLSKGELL